ncbi:NB-ARC DOMAIN CONTAINING PROTEIN EXPRESSED [Salix koriyanagi]|uniref:NB-ARC DOMAIN CONTAINING PROTEIN EXPRESSED n=1 Tax=Salix koriyanagi TaxID=2511006 RepID=A0A9Q0PXB2_9ROSI|nr:NB-ARC DOMAIN CONTAINING PROTEIN EXPRESSED [Salix koriyanagi]
MSEGIVTFLITKLGDFLLERGKELEAVKNEAEYVSDELAFMKAFLRLADAMEESDSALRLLVKKVRDVAYDTEDALDEFRLCLANDNGYGIFSCFRKICRSVKDARARRRISSKIQVIKSRVISITESHRRYCNKNNIMVHGSSSDSTTRIECQRDALLLEEADLVGIEKPKKQLIERLLGTKSGREVVSVVGMGGLGKTTLVRRVYDDPNVKKNYKFRAWITVSQSYKTGDLLKHMIQQLFHVLRKPDPHGVEEMDYDKLMMIINKFLQQRKYLIVLDDVWHINAWDAFKYALPNNNHGSRVLLTTRNYGVASICCMEFPDNVYSLNPLSPEESHTLFCKKIFQKSCCPRHLKKVAEKILGRCEGLPLAIVAISGVLATKDKNRIDEWEMVHRSLGAELEDNNKLKTILSLSYNDLPYYLKSCLLYFSIFPKGHPIERTRLARLWIAEGFVIEKEGATIEEVAGGYLNELLKRSLVQVEESTSDGRVKTCRIHDVLRESIILKARDQEFVAVAKEPCMMWPEKARRLSIHNASQHIQHMIHIPSRLRSLLMFWGVDSLSGYPKINLSYGGLSLLNVLDLQGAPLKEFPSEVVNLFLLKYLSLRYTKVDAIPNSIGNLQNLETLDLKHSRVTELPVGILKLQKLRHLLVYFYQRDHDDHNYTKYGFKAPARIGCLHSVQKLCFIEAKQGIRLLMELGKLNQLRRLGIVKLGKKDGKALCSSIENLGSLRALSVTSIEENEIIDMQSLSSPPPLLQRLYLTGRQEKLPKWISSLHFLVKLVLKWTRLQDDPLVSIQHLPNLVHLEFVQVYDGERLHFKRGGFQRLRILGLNKLNRLKSITVQKGGIPCLQKLIILGCRLLRRVPFGIQHLPELKVLDFVDMPDDFIKRLRPNEGGGGDYLKIRNIPEVYCTHQINGNWEAYSVGSFKKGEKSPSPNSPMKRSIYHWKP